MGNPEPHDDIRPNWLDTYTPIPGAYDELLLDGHRPRPVWQATLDAYAALGDSETQSRWTQGQQEIARNGITYHPHADAGAETRPWQLNALPFVIGQNDWNVIDEGVRQWARLGNAILHDLFGKQRLFADKIVPPDLLYAHPKYCPAYHTAHAPDETRLRMCVSDLSRAPTGHWWNAGIRTRAPLGLGYLIENRVMMSRLYPEAYQKQHIHRVAPFFIALRDSLHSLSPTQSDNPRIVLWTSGPSNPSYFEDAYLARYLNYTLVQSGDLAVRGNRVVLKTLRGLVPIDVLVRRIDDELSDSVELKDNSGAGLAGLIETLRAGNVGMANGLGCNLLEAPIYFAFAQPLAKKLLGEELKIAPVATWWCGETSGLDYVLANLQSLLIRPAFAASSDDGISPDTLTQADRDNLVARIRQYPGNFVGQERVLRSSTPVWTDTGLAARALDLAVFCTATREGYETLPGGLATLSAPPNAQGGTAQESMVQDVWVVSEKRVEITSLLSPPGTPVALRRRGTELPSRVCDNLYWLGRNLERIETIVRIQRVAYRASSDEFNRDFTDDFLAHVMDPGTPSADAPKDEPPPSRADQLRNFRQSVLFERNKPGGLQTLVAQSVKLASTVRDRIALEMWRAVQSVEISANGLQRLRFQGPAAVLGGLDALLAALNGFTGLTNESMTRTDAWIFLVMGRRIERAIQSCDLLVSTLVTPPANEHATLELLLELQDSIMTYRGRYLAIMQIAPTVDLLAIDETNPRSIAYQLLHIHKLVAALHKSNDDGLMGTDERLALAMLNSVRLFDAFAMTREDKNGNRVKLSKQLSKLVEQLTQLSEAISGTYLVHARTPRHFGSGPNLNP